MMQNRVQSIVVVVFVSLFHFLLAWGIAHIPLKSEYEFEDLGNLQMVEVNLGVPTPPEPAPLPEPEPIPEEKPQDIITTAAKDEPVDIIKEVPKLLPPKEAPKLKEKPKPKEKPKLKIEKKSDVAKKTEKVITSQGTNQPIGDPRGREGSTSTQGNSHTSATLGAGFGRSMKGQCSDISNDADDHGTVGLKVTISDTGKAVNVEVISSSGTKRLDNQAKRMASSHTYSPAKANGKAVVGTVTFNIVFKCGSYS
ncbi:MAG: TonB family protein [Pasteurellaceae bacterium]|nr:TonB family protein [Pasteurellaceae bacterium]